MLENKSELSLLTRLVAEYFEKKGREISPNVLQILDKSPIELTDDEQVTYEKIVLPSWGSIREVLKAQLFETGLDRASWQANIFGNPYAIISKIAGEALTEHDLEQKAKEQEALLLAKMMAKKATEGKKTASTRSHWLIVAFIILVCILIAGVAVGSIFAYKAIWGDDNNKAFNEVVGESPPGLSVVFLKDGNLCYCSCDSGSSDTKGTLVDETQEIESFNATYQGDSIVYKLANPSDEQSFSSRDSGILYIYSPAENKAQAYNSNNEHMYLRKPIIGNNGEIWFSEDNGTSASTSIYKLSTITGKKEKVAIYCYLIDLNEGKGTCLIERTERPQGGAISEVCLADLNANVIKSYGSASITPQGWSSKKEHFIGRKTIEGQWKLSNEALLVDKDLNIIATYTVPEEYGELKELCWDEASGYLSFNTSKDALYFVNINKENPPRLLDEGNIASPSFFMANTITPFSVEKSTLSDDDEKQIRDIATLWLDRNTPNKDGAMERLWSSLASDSPIKTEVANAIKANDSIHDKFMFYYEDFFFFPIESYSIDEIIYDGATATAKCTCVFKEKYDEVYMESYPRRTMKIDYVFKKDSGYWKLYDYTEKQV